MERSYDVIVVGCGGVGAAVLDFLAARQLSVLGLEQFSFNHALGSSHGETRIIRQAYFEHPHYVPLVLEAYDLWRELEIDVSESLLTITGLLEVGPPTGELIQGLRASVAAHDLSIDELTCNEARRLFPAFNFSDDEVAVFEHAAGYLRVDDCVAAQLSNARRKGAELRDHCRVRSWTTVGQGVRVDTEHESFEAAQVVVCAGPWTAQTFAELGLPIRVLKKHVHWYQTESSAYTLASRSPIFYFETAQGHYYGFPVLDELGLKVAEHSGGEEVSDPTHVDRSRDARDQMRIESFLSARLAAARFSPYHHNVCFYSMTPDGHFIFDKHPDAEQVHIVGGLSGHGFKFTRVLGKLIADHVAGAPLDPRVAFFGLDRFSDR